MAQQINLYDHKAHVWHDIKILSIDSFTVAFNWMGDKYLMPLSSIDYIKYTTLPDAQTS